MDLDKRTLNLAAAVLCGLGSAIALLSALFGRNRGSGAVLPSLLGAIGPWPRQLVFIEYAELHRPPLCPTTAGDNSPRRRAEARTREHVR